MYVNDRVNFQEVILRTIREEIKDFHIEMSIKASFMTENIVIPLMSK